MMEKTSASITQRALGHVRLSSTARYTHVRQGELAAGCGRFGSPGLIWGQIRAGDLTQVTSGPGHRLRSG